MIAKKPEAILPIIMHNKLYTLKIIWADQTYGLTSTRSTFFNFLCSDASQTFIDELGGVN